MHCCNAASHSSCILICQLVQTDDKRDKDFKAGLN